MNIESDDKEPQYCHYCGLVDSEYDELSVADHTIGPKHICNKILYEYNQRKKDLTQNRNGIQIMASAESEVIDEEFITRLEKTDESIISIAVKPMQKVKFFFEISSDLKNDSMLLICIQLGHPQPQFKMNDHSFTDDNEPLMLEKKSIIKDEISVTFQASDIGHYEMPIMFTFQKNKLYYNCENDKVENIIIIREMVVYVEDNPDQHLVENTHINDEIPMIDDCLVVPLLNHITIPPAERVSDSFEIPALLKVLLPQGLREETIEDFLKPIPDQSDELRKLFFELRALFSQPITKDNYVKYFRHLLWWEETEDAASQESLKRCHKALQRLQESDDFSRIFPEPVGRTIPKLKPIKNFYNKSIASNPQQKSAVEHIVAGTSGLAPYIVFGPPGTGKTVTIVEAILRLVVSDKKHRVMVCTDSNMAADHIALTLLKYQEILKIKNFILRVNSPNREWDSMPSDLASVSNNRRNNSFKPIDNLKLASYRIIVTTLQNAAKFVLDVNQTRHELIISHLFIDEASQGSEPAVLIPITGLLAPTGQLILAGDPQQLGPVCVSRHASKRGLGTSLLERLYKTKKNLYDNNSTYITTLVKNFRSHSDILQISNELFYDNRLQALGPLDELSEVSILGLSGGDRAIVFHSVNSSDQRLENGVSFFNVSELEMVQRYLKVLIEVHGVSLEDIGVITPYTDQVNKIIKLLKYLEYDKVEVGTVEAFQGKEKRVIIVSMVRANCKLLDYDAKYGMGFVVDDKRFNVTITRAKSKLVIIGNETCLKRDYKWRVYMERCKQYKTYYGEGNEQINRDSKLLIEVAQTRFKKCRLTDVLFKDKQIKKKK